MLQTIALYTCMIQSLVGNRQIRPAVEQKWDELINVARTTANFMNAISVS
jgi:hypothetical protein